MRYLTYTTLLAGAIGAYAALGCAIMAKAEGLPSLPTLGTNGNGSAVFHSNCYLKGYGQGSFVDHSMGSPAASVDGLSGKDLGGGLGLGCDYVANSFFVGLFADYTFQDAKFSALLGGSTMTIPFGNEWSVGGRVGFLANPYTGIYVSNMAEYFGGSLDKQLLYNAITYPRPCIGKLTLARSEVKSGERLEYSVYLKHNRIEGLPAVLSFP